MIKENDLWFVFPLHCVSLAFSLLIASDTERVPFRDWFIAIPCRLFSYFLLPAKSGFSKIRGGNTLGGIDMNWLVSVYIGVTFSFNHQCKIPSLAWLTMKQITPAIWHRRGQPGVFQNVKIAAWQSSWYLFTYVGLSHQFFSDHKVTITNITCFAGDTFSLQRSWLLLWGGTTQNIHKLYFGFPA